MKTFTINGIASNSMVFTNKHLIDVEKYLPHDNVFIITDDTVKKYYGSQFPDFPCYSFPMGEGSKNFATAEKICRWLLENGADRNSFVLGIGGGVVCDLSGFVASVYMRGVRVGFVATSLLAHVDASVGGKNGVNVDGFKNIIGTFNQPEFVLCDIAALATLPREEFSNGFAEIIKHTLIADKEMFMRIESNPDDLRSLNPILLHELVSHSIAIKTHIVQSDEHERGERKKLNLGHTWGHAVEKITGLSHGKSVSLGLEFAARLSVKKGLLKQRDYMRIVNVLRELNLPVCHKTNPVHIFEALKMDKKKSSESVDFVLMNGIGDVVIQNISFDEIAQFIGI